MQLVAWLRPPRASKGKGQISSCPSLTKEALLSDASAWAPCQAVHARRGSERCGDGLLHEQSPMLSVPDILGLGRHGAGAANGPRLAGLRSKPNARVSTISR